MPWTAKREEVLYQGKKYLFIKNEDVNLILVGTTWYPLGKYVLLQRMTQERQQGLIVIPERSNVQIQTLDCMFVRHGWMRNNKSTKELIDLNAGDSVRLSGWDQSMKEYDLSGSYYITCPVKNILYKNEMAN